MRILLCIDDTDDLEKGRGTGSLAQEIADCVVNQQWGTPERITRHQLLLHEDIPYTSHNSSMCFAADIEEKFYEDLIHFAQNFLETEHAKGSDPGLCVVKLETLENSEKLIEFGKKAQNQVLKMEDAYELARSLNIHLSEHGGTGQGIIGALAGTGLRLSGNDGEFKGGLTFVNEMKLFTADQLYTYDEIDEIILLDGITKVQGNVEIKVKPKSKTILRKGKAILLITQNEGNYECCNKQQIRNFGDIQ